MKFSDRIFIYLNFSDYTIYNIIYLWRIWKFSKLKTALNGKLNVIVETKKVL